MKKGEGKGPYAVGMCRYEVRDIEGEKTLVTQCDSCPIQGNFDTDTKCRSALIMALKEEYSVSSVLINSYKVTKFTGPTFKTLRMIADIYSDIARSSGWRTPMEDKKGGERACSSCRYSPHKYYDNIQKALFTDLSVAHKALLTAASTAANAKADRSECSRCLNALKNDITALFNRFEDLRGHIAYNAYRIVLEEC